MLLRFAATLLGAGRAVARDVYQVDERDWSGTVRWCVAVSVSVSGNRPAECRMQQATKAAATSATSV